MTNLNVPYLAGFVDGEGCFWLDVSPFMSGKAIGRERISIHFIVTQRADNARVLRDFARCLGGAVYTQNRPAGQEKAHPACHWRVGGRTDVLRLIECLDEHPPVVKAKEYAIWREAALYYYCESKTRQGSRRPQIVAHRLRAYADALKACKSYGGRTASAPLAPEARAPTGQLRLSL